MKIKGIDKVRACVTDRKGRVYMIASVAAHRLQLPGGGVKRGEDLIEAVKREVREETGFTKIKIKRHSKPLTVTREDGTKETSICFLVVVSGKPGQPVLTAREERKGLHITRYASRKAALAALADRRDAYGRSAVRRDLELLKAVA